MTSADTFDTLRFKVMTARALSLWLTQAMVLDTLLGTG
jgi:hypothetical protein